MYTLHKKEEDLSIPNSTNPSKPKSFTSSEEHSFITPNPYSAHTTFRSNIQSTVNQFLIFQTRSRYICRLCLSSRVVSSGQVSLLLGFQVIVCFRIRVQYATGISNRSKAFVALVQKLNRLPTEAVKLIEPQQ